MATGPTATGPTATGPRGDGGAAAPPLAALAVDTARCLRFYSRLPVPRLPWEAEPHAVPDFAGTVRMLPLAGALIGLAAALALGLAAATGLGPLLGATLAVATLAAVTGAMHEDGLADMADGFGGGATVERRLQIMQDSRIGAFGASALILAFALRIAALATLIERAGWWPAMLALVVAAALSRTAGLMPLALLPAARAGGASASVGRPTRATLALALAMAAGLAVLARVLGLASLGGIGLGAGLALLAAYGVTRLSARCIAGQTGDVAGAAQQVAEIGFVLGLVMASGP